jgi:hypothetical protein
MTGSHSSVTSSTPIEDKVKASTAATALVTLAMTGLANMAQGSSNGVVLRGVNEWVDTIVSTLISTLVTFAAGYAAKHTHRPDLRTPPELNL